MKKHFLAIAALIIATFTESQKEQSEFTTESHQGTCGADGKRFENLRWDDGGFEG